MSLFCLLWVPLFYMFWRSVAGNSNAVGGAWALILGSVVAITQFFVGPFIIPRGFGLSQWMSGCVDIVALPALTPLVVYFVFTKLKIISGTADFANFALLWLIPVAVVRALGWSSQNYITLLFLVPILWTSIATGIPFFINMILNSHRYVVVPASIAILFIPFAAASSYWAFHDQKTSLGFVFCFAAAAPMLVSIAISYVQAGEGK